MTATLDLIASQALSLPEHERMILAHRLLRSAEAEPEAEIEAAWEAEIARRFHEYETGKVRPHTAEEFFAHLDSAITRP